MSGPIRLCRECRHSIIAGDWWDVRIACGHPAVTRGNSVVLAAAKPTGASAERERAKRLFGACGRSGKLWESTYRRRTYAGLRSGPTPPPRQP